MALIYHRFMWWELFWCWKELGGDWKAVSGSRPETQMSSSHGLHLDILSEPLELCEPVVFEFF